MRTHLCKKCNFELTDADKGWDLFYKNGTCPNCELIEHSNHQAQKLNSVWSSIKNYSCGWVGLLLGIIVAIPALILAAASTGAGHGDYYQAKQLFPFTMLSSLFGSISYILLIFALFQYPIYGFIIGVSIKNKKYLYVIFIAVLHIFAVWLNFHFKNTSFS